MCQLSIIVPTYNSAQYIKRTVDALLTQHGYNYEIIIVDDGSTDNSSEICHALEKFSPQVRYIQTENGGPGRARNIGIQAARGEYIAFCDADDVPGKNMYGTLLDLLISRNADLSLCDIFSERNNCDLGFPWSGDKLFTGSDVLNVFLASMLGNTHDDDPKTPVWGSSVRCIYKREIIRKFGVTFPEDIRFAEDLVFNVRYIRHCHTIFVINKSMYRYTFNKQSLMNSHTSYRENMLIERKKLIGYVSSVINETPGCEALSQRFTTSQRCYFHECVGNAARAAKKHGIRYSLRETREILRDDLVKKAFCTITATQGRKRLIYKLIQKRQALLLLLYYTIRLRNAN